MNKIYLSLLMVLLALAGCQKASDKKAIQQTPTEQPATESSADSSTSPSADAPVEFEEPASVEYRIVRARIYRSEDSIEILVPENIDVDSNRLIEYEEGEDGRYYFVSLLPQ